MKNSIEVKNVSKTYQDFKLENISFTIPSGSIIGLVGENGAGKTTLIKLILNMIKRESGTIHLFGKDNQKDEVDIKKEVGVVLEDSFFSEILKVSDIDDIMSSIYKTWDKEMFYNYLKKFDLREDKLIKDLSKGMKMKLQIITALSHNPKLLILDEPTSGLDPVARKEILDIFQDFIQKEDHTVLLSTHITSDLEHIADYIMFIHKGQLILTEQKDTLIEDYGILKCKSNELEMIQKEDRLRTKKYSFGYEILVKNKKAIHKKYKDMVIDKASIEDILLLLIKGEN